MSQSEELTFTYSGVVTRNGKPIIQVRFERKTSGGDEVAEGILPECIIEKQNGYTPEEIEQLEDYLKQNRKEIMGKAKELNNITHWF